MFWRGGDKDKKNQTPQYRIAVKAAGDSTNVQVLARDGGLDSSDISQRILGLLQDQLK
jgi:outer membrane protein assembly factor BamC